MSKYCQVKQIIESMSDSDFMALFNKYKSISSILHHYLNINSSDPRIRKLIIDRRDQLNIVQPKNKIGIITDKNVETIRQMAANSKSITELLYKLHLQPIGGNFTNLRVFLQRHNITLSSGTLVARHNPQRWSNDAVYCQNSLFNRRSLRKRALSDNILQYKCAICGNEGVWNNQQLNLQIDHINGISTDNRIENLRWLCPNCHSQTTTYAGRNNKKKKNK